MRAGGPYFDELTVGHVFPAVAGVTLTDGLAAVHQAIVGDRLALSLDAELAREVTGGGSPGQRPVNPALVWDVAIGQSTVATQHAKANLFYRGLWFRRLPVIGDTLRTTTRVEGLRQNRPREGRAATGLTVLRITTVDDRDRPVLDFWRCAMLPLRDPAGQTGHADDLDTSDLEAMGASAKPASPAALLDGWRLDRFAEQGFWPQYGDLVPGEVIEVDGGDVVVGAPELARLTLNIARVHHDEQAAGGTRLVYGGHTIGIALSQAARALPGLVTVTGWHSCDHVGPVHEGDTLHSTVEIESAQPLGAGGLVGLRSRVYSAPGQQVLDWRFVAVLA
jgi:acyl dehydratase